MTGSGDEEITRHVICCLLDERGEDDVNIPPNAILPAGVSSDKDTDSLANVGQQDAAVGLTVDATLMAYKISTERYHYIVSSCDQGWDGRTYTQAHSFYGEMAGYGICPFEAICSMGPDLEHLVLNSQE